MNTNPHRAWNGTELATHLDIPPHNLLTQLAEWARLGLLTKTTKGHYTPNPHPPRQPNPPPNYAALLRRMASPPLTQCHSA